MPCDCVVAPGIVVLVTLLRWGSEGGGFGGVPILLERAYTRGRMDGHLSGHKEKWWSEGHPQIFWENILRDKMQLLLYIICMSIHHIMLVI